MTDSTLRITIRSDQAEKNARNLARELNTIDRNGVGASRSMDSMSVATRSLAGYMAGILTVGTAINRMDTYTGLNNKLMLVTNSQGELNTALGDTFKIAQNTAQAWESVAQIYQRFSDNAKTLNINQAQTAQLTDTVSKAIAISGGSAQSAEAALIQFSQALASNVLRGEELNSVMEQAPGLAKAIAQGMGITVGQLRSVAAEGKITGDVLVKALTASKESVDNLFSKTDFTISQSLTQLSNEVTKFVGEAGKGSGAANLLSGSITALSQSLSTIANVAAIGGVALLTKTILTQTVAVYGSITASALRRKDMLADLATQATASATEVRRTAALAQFSAMQLADAKATAARMTGMQRLAYIQTTLIPLEAKATQAIATHTATTAADTVVQNANNAARSRGAMFLSAIGGTVGALTIGVAALAAGYIYFSAKAAEANKKIKEQAEVANQAKDALVALKGIEKDKAVDDMTASFERQNQALADSSSKINIQLDAIKRLYVGNEEIVKIVDDAQSGTITMTEAVKKFNEIKISKDIYESVKKNSIEFQKNAEEAKKTQASLALFNIQVKLTGMEAQNAAVRIDENSNALTKNETAAQKAAKAQTDYFKSLNQDVLSANERLAYMGLGFSSEVIDQINKLKEAKQKILGDGVTVIITDDEIKKIVSAQKTLDAVKDTEDAITKAKRDQTSEAEKQAKLASKQAVIMAGSNEQTKNMLKVYQAFRSAGVADTKARVLTAQVGREGDFLNKNLFGSHSDAANGKTNSGMISWQGSRSKSLTQYLQGQGVLDKKGNIEQTQEALNAQAKFLIQEIMTNKTYSSSKNALLGDNTNYRELEKTFGKNAIAWDYDGKSIGSTKASKNLSRQDNYYNSLNKILGGDAENALSSIKDIGKYDDDAYKAKKDLLDRIEQLQSQYDTEAITRSKARDEEINQATILGQADLIPRIKERYDSQDKLATMQQEYEVEGYKWTEEKKLQFTYDTNVLRLAAEGKFSDDQKNIIEKGLKDQFDQEKAMITYAKEERIFQMQQGLMSANAASEKYWSLERQRILMSVKDVQERNRQLEITNALQDEEKRTNLNSATKQWGQTEAQMNGSGNQYQLNQERFSRIDQSQDVFDAQLALAETAEEREAIWKAHHDRMTVIETDYQARSIGLQANQAAQFAGIMQGMVSESSTAHAALGAIQKGAALFSTTMNSYTAISAAWASAPFPYNLGAVASATLETGLLQAAVSALSPQGYADGGYTGHGGKYDVAGLVHKGEGVLTQEEIRAVGGEQGFNQLRQAIRSGYADGGLVKDTNRVGIGQLNAVNGASNAQAKQQAQANVVANETRGQSSSQSQVNLNPNFVIVDERENLGDYLFSPDGTKAFVKFFKRNRSALGV